MKLNVNKLLGYMLIYFMLIWNQSNLKEVYIKKYAFFVLLIFAIVLFLKSKKLTIWCGICSIVLFVSMLLVRIRTDGIGINALILLLSSVYISAVVVVYNKTEVFTRLVNVIVFLASISICLWLLCLLVPAVYERWVPRYETLMSYKIYSTSFLYENIRYGARGLFLYTMREVDKWRNTGIFTEPGIYQMVLNIGIYILILMNDKISSCKNIKFKLAILIITLCTTQSTTGFIGFSLIMFFYFCKSSKDKKKELFSKYNFLIGVFLLTIVLYIDYQVREENSMIYITIINKLFSKGNISLVDNSSSAARVGTIILTIGSMIKHPFGIGYDGVSKLLNTEKTGFVAAEIFKFGAVWGILPLCFVLWWIFSPLKNKMKKSDMILYIFIYVNTLLAQSNMFYPIFILIPIAFKYGSLDIRKIQK